MTLPISLSGLPRITSRANRNRCTLAVSILVSMLKTVWRAKSNFTVNYGLRWEFSMPWYEQNNQVEALVPGEQSVLYPGAPLGWVVPGDPGIPSTVAPTRYRNFGPRIGFAYSPEAQGGFWRKLLGGPGNSSIRAGLWHFTTRPSKS